MNQPVMPAMPEFGKAVYGRTGFGHGWFHIEDNKDNVFRVLPPMKSLAREGKYAKFYQTHRGFRGSDNKQRPFLCIEESDYKTKVIKVHCPICDWVDAIEKQIADYKAKGATDDQIREYRNKYIFPFQAERKYYINVVNQEGKVGVLPIGSKMYKSLEALALEQGKSGRDITGMEGYYVNFKKQTRFKGDRDAIHTASLYMHPDGTGGYRPVNQVIDQTFAQRLATEAADLAKLFKSIEVEQMAQIIALEGDARAKYVDTLFNAKDDQVGVGQATVAPAATQTAPAPSTATLPPGPAPAAAQTLPNPASLPPPTGFGAPAPMASAASQPLPPPAATQQTFTPQGNLGPQGAAPAFAGFGAPSQPAAPTLPGAQMSPTLNNEEFVNMVRPQNKG